MLTEYLDARDHVTRRQVQNVAMLVLDHGRVWNSPLDGVVVPGWMMRSHQQRHLGAALQDVFQNALVCLAGFFPKRIDRQGVAQALDDG